MSVLIILRNVGLNLHGQSHVGQEVNVMPKLICKHCYSNIVRWSKGWKHANGSNRTRCPGPRPEPMSVEDEKALTGAISHAFKAVTAGYHKRSTNDPNPTPEGST